MTNEERLDRLETLVMELIKDYAALRAPLPPTLERQYAPDGSTSITPGTGPGKTYSILGSDGEIIFSVRRLSDQQIFKKGDNTRLYNLDFLIDSFNQTESDIYATLNGITQSVQMTVPLSDLTPLTTGGMSANWTGKVKDWEITAFRANEKHLLPDSIHHVEPYIVYVPDYLTSECYEIYSVKRLSDGSTWTLGDEVFHKATIIDTAHLKAINKFIIQEDHLMVSLKGFEYWIPLNELLRIEALSPAPSVKEWEIVEFIGDGHRLTKRDGKFYCDGLDMNLTEQEMIDGNFTIHSVRRCSDGTAWSVGDKINLPVGDCEIKRFEIIDGSMMVEWKSGSTWNLSFANKRKLLFTTADGVEVFEGDTIYYFSRPMASVTKCLACDGLNWANHYSTHEAALAAYEKWLYEQPVLTLAEIDGDHRAPEYMAGLVQIVKDKLAKS